MPWLATRLTRVLFGAWPQINQTPLSMLVFGGTTWWTSGVDLEAANRRANELQVVLLRNGFRRVAYEQ